MPVKTKIQVRRDTAANWTSTNPTLAAGEQGWETDTKRMKVGDGTTAWTSLGYFAPTAKLVQESNATVTVSNTTAETALFSFSQAAVANTCMYRIRAGGTILNNTGGNRTYAYTFKIGSTTVFSRAAQTFGTSANTRKWFAEFIISMVGSKTSQVCTAMLLQTNATTANWDGFTGSETSLGTNTAAEDMSTAKTISFNVTIGAAASANANMVLNFFNVEEITE